MCIRDRLRTAQPSGTKKGKEGKKKKKEKKTNRSVYDS